MTENDQAATPPRSRFSALLPKLDRKQARHAMRTAVAVLVTFVIAHTLELKQGYWAVISTLLVMQTNLGGSLAAGWLRFLGTAMGAAMGVLSVSILGHSMAGLCAALLINALICSYLTKLHESFRNAGITALVVVLAGGAQDNLVLLGLTRFLEISLGVAVAMLVSFFVLPARATDLLRQHVARGLEDIAGLYATVFGGYMQSQLDPEAVSNLKKRIEKQHETNRRLLSEARNESMTMTSDNASLDLVLNFADRVFESVVTMHHAAEKHDAEGFRHILAAPLAALSTATLTAFKSLADNVAAAPKLARPPDEPALNQALASLDEALAELRRSKTSRRYRLDEVIHFFSFTLAMQDIGRETLAATDRLFAPQSSQACAI